MPQFYARYVPPAAVNTLSQANSPSNDLKRKNIPKPDHKQKKRKLDGGETSEQLKQPQSKGTRVSTSDQPDVALEQSSPVEKKYQPKKERKEKKEKKQRKQPQQNGNEALEQEQESTANELNGSLEGPDEEEISSKHSKVLSRFSKSKERASHRQETDVTEDQPGPNGNVHPDRANVVHDLRPIPQPENRAPERSLPTYSTAPDWLRKPVVADQVARKSFGDLGLHKVLLKNLDSQGKKAALPIQSAVLALLLDKEVHERPDLCVAAATGSGKTFVYTLPILSGLRKRNRIRLRAVIVVPTRTLVKQVVQTFESCSAGLDVRIGTAEGSKTLAEEQRQLVEETLIYDPDEYQRLKEAPIDWSTFSLDELIEDATHRYAPPVGHVQTFLSKVDVLVCTPGRLVEHLQTTKGFNLDDVQWFVADEADRLLNESYHEWLEAVLPALKSQKATEQRDKMLRHAHMHVPKRRVTKILLSATMTNDISQLLALELTSPKLVVVEEHKSEKGAHELEVHDVDGNAEYNMPPGLMEYAIAFKDSENKPLYLLQLLNKHIFTDQPVSAKHQKEPLTNGHKHAADDEDTSSSSSSEDDSDSDDTSSAASSSSSEADSSDASSLSSSTSSSASSPRPSSPIIDHPHPSKIPDKPHHPLTLIFTRSTESAHRLTRLLTLLSPSHGPLLATFTRSSSTTSTQPPTKILNAFTSGRRPILISTDLAARGLDIPHLSHVINYDVPASALSYVHRVGRTARAGREGRAWTLVEWRQGRWFWGVIGGKGTENGQGREEKMGVGGKRVIGRGEKVVEKVNLGIDKERWMGRYEEALRQLGEDVRAK